MTLCVIMTGCLWGGLQLPDQLTAVFSLPLGLRGFASLFPPQSISAVLCVPLSISVCVDQWINKHLSLLPPCFLCSPAFPTVGDRRRGVQFSWWSDTRNFLFLSASLPLHPPLHHDTAGLREVAPHPEQVPLR